MEIVRLPDVNERLKGLAVDPTCSTSEEFARLDGNPQFGSDVR